MTHTKHKEIMEKVEELHDWCWRIDDTSENIEKAEEVKEQLKTLISSALLQQLEELERWVERKMQTATKRKNEIENDPFHPARCQYLGQEDALRFVSSHIREQKELIKKQ